MRRVDNIILIALWITFIVAELMAISMALTALVESI